MQQLKSNYGLIDFDAHYIGFGNKIEKCLLKPSSSSPKRHIMAKSWFCIKDVYYNDIQCMTFVGTLHAYISTVHVYRVGHCKLMLTKNKHFYNLAFILSCLLVILICV